MTEPHTGVLLLVNGMIQAALVFSALILIFQTNRRNSDNRLRTSIKDAFVVRTGANVPMDAINALINQYRTVPTSISNSWVFIRAWSLVGCWFGLLGCLIAYIYMTYHCATVNYALWEIVRINVWFFGIVAVVDLIFYNLFQKNISAVEEATMGNRLVRNIAQRKGEWSCSGMWPKPN